MHKQDGKTGNGESLNDDETDEDFDGEATLEIDTDNVGEASVEINIQTLMAEMEAEGISTDALAGSDKRKRLDEAMEQRRIERELRELESFDFD